MRGVRGWGEPLETAVEGLSGFGMVSVDGEVGWRMCGLEGRSLSG